MTTLGYALAVMGGLCAALWVTAWLGGYLAGRRGLSELEFIASLEPCDGHVERTFAHLGYGAGRRRERGLAGTGGTP